MGSGGLGEKERWGQCRRWRRAGETRVWQEQQIVPVCDWAVVQARCKMEALRSERTPAGDTGVLGRHTVGLKSEAGGEGWRGTGKGKAQSVRERVWASPKGIDDPTGPETYISPHQDRHSQSQVTVWG